MPDLSSVKFFSLAIFSLATAKQIFFWSWLWQLKEYRIDRMKAHFQDIGLKNSLLAVIGYSSLRQNKRPDFTAKSAFIIFTSFFAAVSAFVLILWQFSPIMIPDTIGLTSPYTIKPSIIEDGIYWNYETIAVASVITFFLAPLLVFLSVLFFNRASNILKRRIVEKAGKKIAGFPNLTVIGITGSYGKSTAKEILYEILSKSKKYSASGGSPPRLGEAGALGGKVLKTPANINTVIGIAQLILKDLTAEHQIFIAEIGAYKRGEIKEICEMVKPKIGILTAINEQHLALFGSIENTIAAKFELIEALSKDGLAILNIGDKNIQKGLESGKIAAERKLYSAEAKADVSAIDIDVLSNHFKFRAVNGAQIQDFKVNLIGRHNVSNALAAIVCAEHLGMSTKEISEILRAANRFPHTFFSCTGPNGSIFINDAYNANPDGVTAGIDYLKDQPGRKIIVMSSLIELGAAARTVHRRLGKQISKIAQKLILTDDYYAAEIKKGAAENGGSSLDIKIGNSAKIIADYLRRNLKPSDTVLFINRGAGKVLELLKK